MGEDQYVSILINASPQARMRDQCTQHGPKQFDDYSISDLVSVLMTGHTLQQ